MPADLLERLAVCTDDTARLALLAVAEPEELARLHAALAYHQFIAESDAAVAAEQAAFAAFTASLVAAASDEERRQLIKAAQADRARGPAWVAEWAFHRTSNAEAWRVRYIEMVR